MENQIEKIVQIRGDDSWSPFGGDHYLFDCAPDLQAQHFWAGVFCGRKKSLILKTGEKMREDIDKKRLTENLRRVFE